MTLLYLNVAATDEYYYLFSSLELDDTSVIKLLAPGDLLSSLEQSQQQLAVRLRTWLTGKQI